MAGEFEIRREVQLPVSPAQAWDAVTSGTGGWLWPMEYEAREGGRTPDGGTIVAWDPPRHLTVTVVGENGQIDNNLDHVIEAREDGALLRYVHSGIFTHDWDDQYDGAGKHTDFYLHTLEQYVRYFTDRRAAFAQFNGPAASTAADASDVVRARLGITADVSQGDTVRLSLDGIDPVDAVVDYLNPNFLGLRTEDAMYRFFGRNQWGAPVGISLHLFADDADVDKTEQRWSAWLDGVFA
jgi:hypothetical protein